MNANSGATTTLVVLVSRIEFTNGSGDSRQERKTQIDQRGHGCSLILVTCAFQLDATD